MSRSRARRRPFALTRRGWGFVVACVALLAVSYTAGSAQVQLAAGLVIALLVVALLVTALRRPAIEVTRTFAPAFVAAGGSAIVTLRVRNLSRRSSIAAEWHDDIPWSGEATGRLPALGAGDPLFAPRGSSSEVRYRLVPPTRGIVEIGPLHVDFEDPFGLVHGSRRVAGSHRLVVTPAVVPLTDAGFGFAAGEGNARLVQRSMLGNDDDLMTREYRRGDAMRRIHWRVSARQGELMVRQEEQRAKPELRLVIDTRITAYGDVESDGPDTRPHSETFEWVVRMVASLGVHLHGAGFEVAVLETTAPQIAGFERGDARTEEFLASLAAISLVDDPAPLAPRDAGAAGPIFAVLAETDADVLEWLIRMRRPTERGVVFLPIWATRARTTLDAAGWHCVVFRTDDDLAAVWASVRALETRA